jgi:hypothetical protein
MQHLEVSYAVRPMYGSLGAKRLIFSSLEAKDRLCDSHWRIEEGPEIPEF